MTVADNTTSWNNDSLQAVQDAVPRPAETKRMEVQRLISAEGGRVIFAQPGHFTAEVDVVCDRPTKFDGRQDADPDKLNELFSRSEGGVYYTWHDSTCWESLRLLCEQRHGVDLLAVSRSMNVLLILRAGISLGGKLDYLQLPSVTP